MVTLPQNLQAFIVIFSNPAIMAVGLSIGIEHIPFIQDDSVSNLVKIAFTLVIAFLWAVLATLLTTGTPVTPDGWYGLIVLGLGVAMSMNIYNKLVDQGFPWLKDLLTALFGKSAVIPVNNVTVTSTTSSAPTTETQPDQTTMIPG